MIRAASPTREVEKLLILDQKVKSGQTVISDSAKSKGLTRGKIWSNNNTGAGNRNLKLSTPRNQD